MIIMAGVGFQSAAVASDIVNVVLRAQRESSRQARGIAVPAFKAGHEALAAAAASLELPLILIEQARLEAVQARCVTRSSRVAQATGLASVAEACALGALDDRATLILARIADAHATCALALGDRL
jgi:cobalt-precorrin 5A hydrolase